MTDFEAVPGRGLTAAIDSASYFAGNALLMEEKGVDVSPSKDDAQKLSSQGKTLLYFAREKTLLGVIAVADKIKPTSAAAVSRLKAMGKKVVMLTGDNSATAQAIADQVKVDRAIAQVLPQDKESEIRRVQQEGGVVAMVGDGII